MTDNRQPINFELECGHTAIIRVVNPGDARHVKCDTCRTIKNVTKAVDLPAVAATEEEKAEA